MNKMKGKSTTSAILSVIMVLICLLLPILTTNAWFTSGGGQKVQIVINVNNINLQVYQKLPSSTGEGTLIKTHDKNNEATQKSYVDLNNEEASREILPDTQYSLNLTLKNADMGTIGVYVRYKFDLLINGTTADTSILLNISGQDAPNGTNAGFAKNDDGYYYYRNSAGNQRYPSGANLNMLTSFSIPYSEFVRLDNINADTIKLIVTIEGFDVDPTK